MASKINVVTDEHDIIMFLFHGVANSQIMYSFNVSVQVMNMSRYSCRI